MLQRAASNAYSWWWASHIRTKQSKWLEQSLQDMEEKAQYMLKLIEEDGDSFAKRAEMYYKKRPELINFVEESYRAFRALAERYDKLSTELQNANNTLATVFPEQFQLEMEEDDDLTSPKLPRGFPQVPVANASNVPKVPKAPIRDWKGLISASKQLQAKKSSKTQENNKTVAKSGLSKAEAFEEIDKLQKDILGLQTVKEFVKSSYQSGLTRYWGIENQIMDMQQRVCSLRDEFGVNKVIEDDEARTLMAEAALKSCQETLVQLQEKQERYNQEARDEYKKVEDAHQKLKSIRREFLHDQTDEEEKANEKDQSARARELESSNKEVANVAKERQGKELTQEKIKVNFEVGSLASLTVTELAEKIDELVNKVISLETSVSSQTVLMDRMRTEADDLHSQIRTLEEDKVTLIDDTQDLRGRVQKMEEKLNGIQDLNRNVESQNSNLQTHFAEALSSLDHLSEKLNTVKPDEDEGRTPKAGEDKILSEKLNTVKPDDDEGMTPKAGEDKIVYESPKNVTGNGKANILRTEYVKDITEQDSGPSVKGQLDSKQAGKKTVKFQEPMTKELSDNQNSIQTGDDLLKTDSQAEKGEVKEGEFNWQQMLLSGLEDKEKILLSEYTTILRNYKETKRKLCDMEKKDRVRDHDFDVTVQIRELRNAIIKRDEEIQYLRQELSELQGNPSEAKDDRSVKPEAKSKDLNIPPMDKEDEDIKLILIDQPKAISPVEEKLRMEIDAILDENLDFWLRFSTSYHQIQKFKTTVHDLQHEISKLKERKKQEGSLTGDIKSDVRPIYKHMKEIQTELGLWLEQSVVLKDEMERRFSSLCSIQEKITNALKEGVEEDEIKFSSHQAAKFQGEILNMKQENNRVREELQTGVDHVTTLQVETDKTLRKLDEEYELSGDQSQLRHSGSRSRIPLRSFIFGTRQKKQKNSIFACMHPNRKYQVLRAGVQL